MSTTKSGWCSPGTLLRCAAAVAIAATSLVWIDSGARVQAADLEISTPYPSVVTRPGSTVKFELSVTAPAVSVAQVAVDQMPTGWKTTLRGGGFVVNAVTAAPDTPGKVTAEVTVPPDAAAGDYTMEVTVTDGAGQSALPLDVQVQAEVDSGVGVKADFPSLRGDPGTAFSYTLTVTNNTPETQTFTFAAQGPEGWTVAASPVAASNANTVSVDADGTSQVKVSATPPDTAAEGSYPIAVTITSDSGASGSFQLTAEVTGSSKLDVATADQRLNFSGKANSEKRVTLVVGNTGTAAVDAVQFAATPPSGWAVTFDPPKVDEVKPNETTQVVAIIKPAKNALAGDYAIGLRASAGSQASTLDLRYGVKGSQALGIIAIGIIAIVFLGLAWLFRRLGRR
ncbi:MAG: NEW3 domain-containing protein [Ilumatobacteraceae bacterium]